MTTPAMTFLTQAAGYHSPDDAQKMQALLQAMLAERRHIALTSPDTPTLEHYSRLLVRDLRQQPDVKVVAHLPSSTEALLHQFNQLLAELKLSEVVARHGAPRPPVRVFLVHDSAALSSAEFALLVRLVNDLPGANLRIVLIQDRDITTTGSLVALGPQVLHWHIQPPGMETRPAVDSPSREEAREALRQALRESPEPREPRSAREPFAAATTGAAALPAAARTAPTWRQRRTPAATAHASTPSFATGAQARSGPLPAHPGQSKVRRNRVMLVAGLFLSAGLAGALGMWLSMHQPRAGAAPTAKPGAATSAVATIAR